MPGTSASNTLNMIRETVSGLLIKGEKNAPMLILLMLDCRLRQLSDMLTPRFDPGNFRLLLRGGIVCVLWLDGSGLLPGTINGRLDFRLHGRDARIGGCCSR